MVNARIGGNVGTIVEYLDQSSIPEITVETVQSNAPVCLTAFSSDKGPEGIKMIESYTQFQKLYGSDISFAKHGQPLLQAAAVASAGGRLMAKRVVASDATLANAVISAVLTKYKVQKTNAAGLPLYKNSSGEEVTEADSNEPIMIDHTDISYTNTTMTGKKSRNEIVGTVSTEVTETKGTTTVGEDSNVETNITTIPLFVITDNGRGTSNKKFRLYPDLTLSKNLDYTVYKFEVIENNKILETVSFSMDPEMVDGDNNISMEVVVNSNSQQIKVDQFDDNILTLINKLVEAGQVDINTVRTGDFLNGQTKNGTAFDGVSIVNGATDQADLAYVYGLSLASGTDGEFGTSPVKNNGGAYAKALEEFFNGTTTDDIYDMDNYKIDFCADANYPVEVKKAINDLACYREDFQFYCDIGTTATTLNAIKSAAKATMNSTDGDRYTMVYGVFYDIIDPFTKKQITVTIGYSIAKMLVNHFTNRRSKPLCGMGNSAIITDAIEGTVNFIPKITPSVNQREDLEDNQINYVAYYDGTLVIETNYTTQTKRTQLSYGNNVAAIQQAVKAIRAICPRIRTTSLESSDIPGITAIFNKELSKYSDNFRTLTFEYVSDNTYIQNKVYYGAIKVQFKDFGNSEYFKVYALPNS